MVSSTTPRTRMPRHIGASRAPVILANTARYWLRNTGTRWLDLPRPRAHAATELTIGG
jgi:hypothetical protein